MDVEKYIKYNETYLLSVLIPFSHISGQPRPFLIPMHVSSLYCLNLFHVNWYLSLQNYFIVNFPLGEQSFYRCMSSFENTMKAVGIGI